MSAFSSLDERAERRADGQDRATDPARFEFIRAAELIAQLRWAINATGMVVKRARR